MIQELLGGLLVGDRKISTPFSSTSLLPSNTNTSIATTPSCTTTTTIVNSPTNGVGLNNNNNSETNSSQNLRCPRCDSTNTKFCYYNNYNLTQPRHFCKTCRRYWTKGGTLRNVPIGGGCRKNKSIISNNSSSSSTMAKAKANLSSEMLVNNENSLFLGNGLLDHQIQSPGPSPSPILWSSLPQTQNSHILSLLRGSSPFTNPNPNNPSPMFTSLGLDPYGNGYGFAPNFVDNNGTNNGGSNIMDLYERLKSSSSNYGYCNGNENSGSVILGHVVGLATSTSSSMNSTILDPTRLEGGGDHFGGYGLINTSPAISSWSDIPAVPINGAFP